MLGTGSSITKRVLRKSSQDAEAHQDGGAHHARAG